MRECSVTKRGSDQGCPATFKALDAPVSAVRNFLREIKEHYTKERRRRPRIALLSEHKLMQLVHNSSGLN